MTKETQPPKKPETIKGIMTAEEQRKQYEIQPGSLVDEALKLGGQIIKIEKIPEKPKEKKH